MESRLHNEDKPPEHHIETEQRVIHLMLKSREVIDEMLDGGFSSDFFDPAHQLLVDAIYQEYVSSNHKRLLAREGYRQTLVEQGVGGDTHLNLTIFDKCFIKAYARPDDLGYLKKRLVEGFMGRKAYLYLKDFRTEVKKSGFLIAARNLQDRLQAALGITETRRSVFTDMACIKDEFIEQLEERSKNPSIRVECGIPEIDTPINVGFRPQHLTLVVADVGHHKTNLMLNMALNIYEREHSILFIPLEMSRFDLMNRIIANRANIHFDKLARPESLSDDEWKRIRECTVWLEKQHKFSILDVDDQPSVSSLKREIEKRAFVFKPEVVIIDYIAAMKPDVRFGSRNDLEIGEILKSLRFLGKKYGFHTISAAQMGRAAIKALREGKEEAVDSTSIHGSHQYSADSDTIFALLKVRGEPDKIRGIVIKARHGPSGQSFELRVDPSHCRISSTDAQLSILTEATDFESDLNAPPEEVAETLEKEESSHIEFAGLDLGDSNESSENKDEVGEMGL